MDFPYAVPLQLLTGLVAVTLAGIIVHALAKGRPRRARRAGWVAGAWGAAYLATVLAFSIASTERVLDLHQPKRFCGFYLDCHAMVEVVDVRTAPVLGAGPDSVGAEGRFYIVTVRRSSDAGRVPIGIAHPIATVADGVGRHFRPSAAGQEALVRLEGDQPPLGRAILAGQAYTTKLVFDLPADLRDPKLHIAEGDWLAKLSELLLIGDEDSLLHKRTVFRIAPPPNVTG